MICRPSALTLFSLLVGALLLAGCGREAEPEGTEVPGGEALAFEPVAQGFRAAVEDTVEAVFRDAERWRRFSAQLDTPVPPDTVDFDRMMVLVAALPVPAGGYDLRFEAVERTDTAVVASYLFGEPDDDCMAALGRSVPFQAVAVARAEAPVRFERRTEAIPCTLDDSGF